MYSARSARCSHHHRVWNPEMDKANGESAVRAIIGDRVFDQPAGLHAIEITDGKISAIRRLQESELDAYMAQHNGAVIDARGKWVLPGLIDSHVHAIPTGMIMLIGDV